MGTLVGLVEERFTAVGFRVYICICSELSRLAARCRLPRLKYQGYLSTTTLISQVQQNVAPFVSKTPWVYAAKKGNGKDHSVSGNHTFS